MNTFITSDTHFGHNSMVNFLRDDGSKLRPWTTTEEMDEYLVEAWNTKVRPKDTVIHLGDVVINRRALPVVGRLNGTKILVKGNHDVFRPDEYLTYFKDILAYKVFDEFILSHIPVHPQQLYRFKANVHGHLHDKHVELEEGTPDHRYFCASVERTEWAPMAIEEIKKYLTYVQGYSV